MPIIWKLLRFLVTVKSQILWNSPVFHGFCVQERNHRKLRFWENDLTVFCHEKLCFFFLCPTYKPFCFHQAPQQGRHLCHSIVTRVTFLQKSNFKCNTSGKLTSLYFNVPLIWVEGVYACLDTKIFAIQQIFSQLSWFIWCGSCDRLQKVVLDVTWLKWLFRRNPEVWPK